MRLTAAITRKGESFVAQCLEVDVASQGASVEEARKLRNPAGRTAIVPNHSEIARGTMRSILRQADLTPEEFEKLL